MASFRARSSGPLGSSLGHSISRPAATNATAAQLKGCAADSGLEKQKTGASDPSRPWLVAKPGLCVEGKCTTPTCVAYGRTVIHNAGYSSVDLVKDKGQCPCCHNNIMTTTAGFNRCEWKFSGIKQDTPQSAAEAVEMDAWQLVADDGSYERFKDDPNDKTIWTKLVITARKPPSKRKRDEPTAEAKPSDGSLGPGSVECSICCGDRMSRFVPTAINTPCGHCFHRACLKPWLKKHKTCPTCRRDISCLSAELMRQ